MSNPSKRKGTRAETRVSWYLDDHGLPCRRRALTGAFDQGDLAMTLPCGLEVTVEVKTGKQTMSPSRSKVDEWRRQTMVESENSGCPGMLVIVRYRRALKDAEVWMPNSQWGFGDKAGWTMMYLDDFVNEMGG